MSMSWDLIYPVMTNTGGTSPFFHFHQDFQNIFLAGIITILTALACYPFFLGDVLHQISEHLLMLNREDFAHLHTDKLFSWVSQELGHLGIGNTYPMVLIHHEDAFLGDFGQQCDLLFRLDNRSDIPHGLPGPAWHPALGIGDDGCIDHHRDASSLTVHNGATHPGDGRPGFHGLLQQTVTGVALSGGQNAGAGHAVHHFLLSVAGEFFQEVVHVGDDHVGIDNEKRRGKVVQNAG